MKRLLVSTLTLISVGAAALAIQYYYSNKDDSVFKIYLRRDQNGHLPIIDPAAVITGEQAILVFNLYSPLISMSNSGDLVPILAKSWSIDKNIIKFILRENLRSSTGEKIDSKSILYSLKRQILKQTGSHGNLNNFIECEKIKKITDECSGLNIISDNEFQMVAKKEEYVKFLISLLPSLDFHIVPSNAYDHKSLKITSFKNVSGAYSLSGDDLIANSNSILIEAGSIKKIHIINEKDRIETAIDLLTNGKVDFIPTMNGIYEEHIPQLKKLGFSIHRTQNICLMFLYFFKQARKITTPQQRQSFTSRFVDFYKIENPGRNFVSEQQFFPPAHLGRLEGWRLTKFLDWRKEALSLDYKKIPTLRIKPSPTSYEKTQRIAKKMGGIFVEKALSGINSLKEVTSDFAVFFIDIAFNEDISLIHYNIKFDNFSIEPKDSDKWFENYFLIEDEHSRAEILQDLHLNTLQAAKIVPFGAMPYYAVGRKNLELNQPTLTAETHFWKIRKVRSFNIL